MSKANPRILVLFYTMYGHNYAMAKAVVEGVEAEQGEPVLKRVEELVPREQWNEAMTQVQEMIKDVPVADPSSDLNGIDGLIVATPTRYGNMATQMRNFWDQTGQAWLDHALVRKPAAVLTSSNTQHGGQETTIISTMITLLHHGCVLVGLPYIFGEQMTMDEICGGSPYGVSTIAGTQGERMPSQKEIQMAQHIGSHLTSIARQLAS